MIKEFIGIGATVTEATDSAKKGLNAPELADVKTEIVEMPKKKILGLFGGSDAKVKAWYDDGKKAPDPKKKAPKPPVKKQTPKPVNDKKAPELKPEPKKQTEAPKVPIDFDLEPAKAYLLEMVKGLKVDDATIESSIVDGVVNMEIKCEDYGIVIGHRGETLDALQYLTSLYIKKSTDKSVRISLNVGNYREKRIETLKNLARKNASYVSRSGRRYTFEPMNPFERRVIHTTVQEIEGVESRSIGFNQDRRVVLEPTGGVRAQSRGNGNRYNKNNTSKQSNSSAAPKAERTSATKFGKIEVNKD